MLHGYGGGCNMSFGLCVPQPHSFKSLIPLWLAIFQDPSGVQRVA